MHVISSLHAALSTCTPACVYAHLGKVEVQHHHHHQHWRFTNASWVAHRVCLWWCTERKVASICHCNMLQNWFRTALEVACCQQLRDLLHAHLGMSPIEAMRRYNLGRQPMALHADFTAFQTWWNSAVIADAINQLLAALPTECPEVRKSRCCRTAFQHCVRHWLQCGSRTARLTAPGWYLMYSQTPE